MSDHEEEGQSNNYEDPAEDYGGNHNFSHEGIGAVYDRTPRVKFGDGSR